jgi:hypothetical protein
MNLRVPRTMCRSFGRASARKHMVLGPFRRGCVPRVTGPAVLAVALAACTEAPPSVADALTDACIDAGDVLAAAPRPADLDSDVAFMEHSQEAAQTVAAIADDLATRGDDRTIADLAWQLHRFPAPGSADEVVGTAHEAQAAIVRIDGFAHTLRVGRCSAATWRPAGWRAMVGRRRQRPDEVSFRRQLDRLCAETFPEPSQLAGGVRLLDAMGADIAAGPSDDVKARVIARLSTVTARPSEVSRFITDFSAELPRLQPSASLEREYIALLAAFMRLDSAVPSAMPRTPRHDVRERVDAALDELQHAWEALDITC